MTEVSARAPGIVALRLLGAVGVAAGLLIATPSVHAQGDFPSKPIRIYITNPVGGTVGLLAQTIGEGIRAKFGQPVVVEAKPGANGNLAVDTVVRSEPDGYTLVIGPAGPFTTNKLIFANTPYDPVTSLTPISILANSPLVLVVRPSLAATSVAEFIAFAKANPGKLSYSSQGVGATGHLAMELLKASAGLDMVHITYPGSAQAMTDLLGGRVDAAFDNTATSVPHVKSGGLRALAVAEPRRLGSLPEVATMIEAGVPDFVVSPWFGLAGPAGMSPAVVAKLNDAVRETLSNPAIRQRFAEAGVELRGGPASEFASIIKSETDRWSRVVKSAGIGKR